MIKFICIALSCFPLLLSAQHLPETRTWIYEPAQEPREHPVNMLNLRLEVSFEPEAGKVNGSVTHVFAPLRDQVDSIFLDAPGITILSALRAGKHLKYTYNAKGITVFPEPPCKVGVKDSITLNYTCTPRKGIYFIGWNDPGQRSRKQIWTQGQGTDNRYWIPMYDEMNDKVISEIRIRFEDGWQVLSNGNLLSDKKNTDGTRTWFYQMDNPHAPYLIMIGIGKYAIEKRKTRSGTPVSLWYYPEFPEQREPTYRYSTECIDFLEDMTGIAYPWKTYANIPVQDFLYGAMENTTATVFGDFLLVDARGFIDRNYIGTNVHELTHQWFGDYITARSSKNTWLQESYATFYPKRFFKKIYGEDYYEWQLRGEHNSALKASEKDLLPIVHSKAGSARWYPKGSAVIDMMHYVFGEAAMQRVIHHYLKNHAYAQVETNDLYQSFQDTLGLSPMWFFDQWLYRGGEPEYDVQWENIQTEFGRVSEFRVEQKQATSALEGLFKMPVVMQVVYEDDSRDETRVWIESAQEGVRIPNAGDKKVAYVLFDPGSRILKKVNFDKNHEMLIAQASRAEHMIDRYDALLALREHALSLKSDFLKERFEKETFHALKTEILFQLKGDVSADVLRLQALKDKQVEVRLSALQNTVEIRMDNLQDYEGLLQDSSYNVVTAALERLCLDFPENINRYLALTSGIEGSGKKVKIMRMEISATLGNTTAIDTLTDLCSSGFEFITRQNAMQALKRVNIINPLAVQYMADAVFNPNYKLSGTASQILKDFMLQNGYKKMIQQELKSLSEGQAEKQDILRKQGLL